MSDLVAVSASSINFSVEGGIFSSKVLLILSCSSLFSEEIVNIKSPFETLSPIFTFIFSIVPSYSDGTSTLDLSLSKVTTGSFLLILSPFFTSTSIISTFSKSPISGTNKSRFIFVIYIYQYLLKK